MVWNTEAGWPLEEWVVNGKTFIPPTQPFLQADALGIDVHNILQIHEVIFEYYGTLLNFSRETAIIDLEYGKVFRENDNNISITEEQKIMVFFKLDYLCICFFFIQVYEFVIYSNEIQQHPWHIHGHSVNFTGVTIDEDFRSIPTFSPTSYMQPMPILAEGDSFTVPRNGSVTFRFEANNPGPWFMHCHVDWHMKLGKFAPFTLLSAIIPFLSSLSQVIFLGMAFVLNVQKDGKYRDLIPPPPPTTKVCLQWASLGAISNSESTHFYLVGFLTLLGILITLGLIFITLGIFVIARGRIRHRGYDKI